MVLISEWNRLPEMTLDLVLLREALVYEKFHAEMMQILRLFGCSPAKGRIMG